MLPEPFQTEQQNLPSTLTPENQRELRDYLDRCNTELLFINARTNKKQYVQNMISLYSPKWFDKMNEMLEGEDRDLKKVAFQEFNKLQIKKMPTEITGAEGGEIVVRLMDYSSKPQEGEIIEGTISDAVDATTEAIEEDEE